ncbi:MAG: hypothetical protein K0U98_24290 [Deltaproteobacteria bacterium]|nr:hypothetical protein [Deltaproteobacteria bacterium]
MKKWKSVLLGGVLLAVAPAALGQQILCDASSGSSSAVNRVVIENGNLVVSIGWASRVPVEPLATIEVRDRGGVVVASKLVTPQDGGRSEYQVTNDPAFFENNGYWYTVHLTGLYGVELAPPLPALVSLCGPSQACTYSIVQGVGSDGLAMGGGLHDLLESLTNQGSVDLLNDALAQQPQLAEEIFWVADQFFQLLAGINTNRCFCLWYSETQQNPSEMVISSQSGDIPSGEDLPEWQTLSLQGPGSNFGLAGQMHGGPEQNLYASGQSSAGIHLGCWKINSWTLQSWKGLTIKVPALEPCQTLCSNASISVEATAGSQSSADAWASNHQGARGTTSSTVDFYFNAFDVPLLSSMAKAVAERPAGSPVEDPVENFPAPSTGAWQVEGEDGVAVFSSLGDFQISLDPPPVIPQSEEPKSEAPTPAGPWAYGCSTSTTYATLVGESSCAVYYSHKVTLAPAALTSSQGGLLIVPWHP